MEQIHPSWLDHSFLKTTLEGGDNIESEVTIISFSTSPALAGLENFTSFLYRVKVIYREGDSPLERSKSLIMKAPFTTGIMEVIANNRNMFMMEPKIYETFLPTVSKMLKQEFGAKSLKSPLETILVLEDLREEGFVGCDVFKQLDFPHCKLIITLLAKFHAGSVAFNHEDPAFIKYVGGDFLYTEAGPMKPWLKRSTDSIEQLFEENSELRSSAHLICGRYQEIWESLKKTNIPKEKGLNVLNHGDMWTSNVMVKYNRSGEPIQVKLVDYQMTKFGTPVVDLYYIIWTSANDEVREARVLDLFKIYLQTLNDTLEQLGCEERMSVEEMKEDLKSNFDWGLAMIYHLLPLYMYDGKYRLDLGNMTYEDFNNEKTDKTFKGMCNSIHFRDKFQRALRQFESWNSSLDYW